MKKPSKVPVGIGSIQKPTKRPRSKKSSNPSSFGKARVSADRLNRLISDRIKALPRAFSLASKDEQMKMMSLLENEITQFTKMIECFESNVHSQSSINQLLEDEQDRIVQMADRLETIQKYTPFRSVLEIIYFVAAWSLLKFDDISKVYIDLAVDDMLTICGSLGGTLRVLCNLRNDLIVA